MIVAKIEADGLMSQLADEVVGALDSSDNITNLVTALLAFQRKTTQITVGTIAPSVTRALAINNDTLLSALFTLYNSVGGYISVDNNRALNWATDIGEDKGQQIRYRKNLKGITRETKHSELCTRLFPLGSEDKKLSNIYVINETPTKSFDGSYGYLVLTALYASYLGWTAEGDALPDEFEITTGEAWVSPTSDNGAADWVTPEDAYDGDVATAAKYRERFVTSSTLEFTLPSTIISTKLKAMCQAYLGGQGIQTVKIETYHDAAWDTVYDAVFPAAEWFEVNYAAENVEKVRFTFDNGGSQKWWTHLYEVTVYDSVGSQTSKWHQGENERTFRCAIGDYDGGLDYRASYWHADFITAWDKVDAGDDIISKVLTNKYEAYVDSMLDAARLLLTEIKEVPISYKIDTVDLLHNADFDFSFDALQLGSIITVIDEDLGIDVSVRVFVIAHRDLLYPERMSVVLSTKVDTISDYLADLSKKFS